MKLLRFLVKFNHLLVKQIAYRYKHMPLSIKSYSIRGQTRHLGSGGAIPKKR